jgi:hypothetical protein
VANESAWSMTRVQLRHLHPSPKAQSSKDFIVFPIARSS